MIGRDADPTVRAKNPSDKYITSRRFAILREGYIHPKRISLPQDFKPAGG
jgi:hypothetical protein